MKTCPYSRFNPAELAEPPKLDLDYLVPITINELTTTFTFCDDAVKVRKERGQRGKRRCC
jgi:hypothetical protein